MGETRVDLLHLLEDLRDAYPGSLEESILTEIVANALDSGAGTIAITADPSAQTLCVVDDGSGMKRRELARYHDIAASGKARGEGIGFAGVGIKLGLLASQEVVTETRRGKTHVATRWHLASRRRAPWKWVPPAGLVGERGTAVGLTLTSALSPLLDAGFLEGALRRHFPPFFDSSFDEILRPAYPSGIAFSINGRVLEKERSACAQRADLALRLPRHRKPSAAGYLGRDPGPLPEERQGLAVSTFGKVIRRGWEWLGLSPSRPECIGGILEAPALAECLTLNKTDFLRAGAKGAVYLAYRKAIQQAVAAQLGEWGDAPETERKTARARPLERELETVLVDLAESFPLLESLVDKRPGGQRNLPVGRAGEGPGLAPASPGPADEEGESRPSGAAPAAEPPAEEKGPAQPRPEPATAIEETPTARAGSRRRSVRYGLAIRFESRPEDRELARLVESTIWINEAHPAYGRAVASRSEGYHVALASAMALAAVAADPASHHEFITAFFSRWGDALRRTEAGKRTRKR